MTEDPKYAVSLDKVSKVYPAHGKAKAVTALREVTVHMRKGAILAIRGDSGSGKTTLLNLLGGLDVASSGSVVVDGLDLGELTEFELTQYRASRVGFVFQTFNLLPDLTALENVELPMEALGTPTAERAARAKELLQSVGMSERSRHRPARLSGGEQQRVAIARSLANGPALVLADEPTGNLDQRSRRTVLQTLHDVRKKFGTTLIIVTHDPGVAAACEKEYRIKQGKLRWIADHDAAIGEEPEDEGDDDDEPT